MTHREARHRTGSRTTRRRNTKTLINGKYMPRPRVKVAALMQAAKVTSGTTVAL